MIQVRGLSKNYGERTAISDLNFSIEKGEVVGLLGPNGAGKSTTLKIMTGHMAPTSGQVLIDGLDVFEDPVGVKSKIGYLPEVPPVYLDMKTQEYLEFVADLKGVSKANRDEYVARAISKTKLEEVKDRWISNLSKGYRQRVGLAQALVSKPEVLILDEPTVGLDPQQVTEVRNLLLELKNDHTIIVSSHVLTEIQQTCDKVIIIDQGQILAEDKIEDLSQPEELVVFKVSSPALLPTEKLKSFGALSVTGSDGELSLSKQHPATDSFLGDLSKIISDSGAGLLNFGLRTKDLEKMFLDLIKKQREKK